MNRIPFIALACWPLLLISCKKDNSPAGENPPGAGGGLYVAYSTGPQHSDRIANYWNNGVNHVLLNRTSKVYINDIAVAANGDVYTSGCECTYSQYPLVPNQKDDSCKVTLWKNNVMQQFTQQPFSTISNALVEISDAGDIYVVATERLPTTGSVIRLWKNGVRQNVTNGPTSDEATSFYLKGNDVYIGGGRTQPGAGNRTAVLWKNGVPQNLSAATSHFDAVLAIGASGNDVYAGVEEAGSGFLVKNGVKQSQPSGIVRIFDIFVAGADVYVLGTTNFTSTSVWKNGLLLHNLAYDGTSNSLYGGRKMFVKDGDVYAVGEAVVNNKQSVVVWKNGAVVQVVADTQGSYFTSAEAIFIK